ncbi:hypothetical protein BJ973_000456 [Actinoplanes tereljensis]|uniref:Uncharacterized protein n=1 Tax=Paractinoplanes tereljensis TaxID=571912 RepID=A0A919NRW1_9ACTN|nr:hypothetical protein [Actinoplanes tereljensis]GIF23188.1 hypothetical protein Ate02nite_59180 [Actinoplanes tereljensis]
MPQLTRDAVGAEVEGLESQEDGSRIERLAGWLWQAGMADRNDFRYAPSARILRTAQARAGEPSCGPDTRTWWATGRPGSRTLSSGVPSR